MTRTGYLAAVIAVLVCCTSVTAAVLVFNPSGTYTTKQSIGAARTATDAAGKEVVITTPYVLTAATAWPADRALRIAAGGSIAFSGGGSLSIPNGPTFSGTTKLLEGFTTKPFAPRVEHFYNTSTARGRTFTQLSTAKRALGTNKATLEFSTPQGASTITVPSNIELIPRNGATITVDTGKMLTYAGSTTNWPTAVPIFTGAGTVTLATSQPAYTVWGGGLTDSALASVASGGRLPFASNAAFRGCLVRNNATQSVSSATQTAIDYQTEIYDTDSIHDTGSNVSRLTVPAGVTKIRLTANVSTLGTTATGAKSAEIWKNGATGVGLGYVVLGSTILDQISYNIASAVVTVTAGDYFQVTWNSTSTGTTTILNNSLNWFAMEIVE